jgi:hypothetical protein
MPQNKYHHESFRILTLQTNIYQPRTGSGQETPVPRKLQ